MTDMQFSFGEAGMARMDQIRERCGHETYAAVLDTALGFYYTVTELAADGYDVVLVDISDRPGCTQRHAEIRHVTFTEAYNRARAQERELAPPVPEPVLPAAPSAPRPWWKWWR